MFKWPLLIVCCFAANIALAESPLRDPTQPLSAQIADEKEEFELHSVLISNSRKVAVINGFSVREGEALPSAAQWVVQEIEPSAVVITDQQQRRRLQLASRLSGVKSAVHKSTGNAEYIIKKQGCHNSTCTEVKQ